MRYVYVVRGHDNVYAVFSDDSTATLAAERMKDLLGRVVAWVEEFELNPTPPEPGLTFYLVQITREGLVHRNFPSERKERWHFDLTGDLRGTVPASHREHAAKLADAERLRLIAAGQWPFREPSP